MCEVDERGKDAHVVSAKEDAPPPGTRLLIADTQVADTFHDRAQRKDEQGKNTHPREDTPLLELQVVGVDAQETDTSQDGTQTLDEHQQDTPSVNAQEVAPQSRTQKLDEHQQDTPSVNAHVTAPNNRTQTLDEQQEFIQLMNVEEFIPQNGDPLLEKRLIQEDKPQDKAHNLCDQPDDIHKADGDGYPLQNEDTLQTDIDDNSSGPLDGGWGWVVCFTAMWVYGNTAAILTISGMIYVAILEEYSRGDLDISFKTSWVMSLASGLMFLMSVVTGILCDRFGFRKVTFCGGLLAFVSILSSAFVTDLFLLYLTYGQVNPVLLGAGFGLTFSPALVILGFYFKRRLGLANGIVMFGSASLTMTYALVLPRLLELLGLTLTLVCLSGAMFLFMPCTLAWKPARPAGHQQDTLTGLKTTSNTSTRTRVCQGNCVCCGCGSGRLLNTRIWRNKRYVVWLVAFVVCFFGHMTPFVHVVKHSEDVFPDSSSSLLPFCIGAGSVVSRIIVGVLIDHTRLNRVYLQGASLLIMGISTFCLPLAVTFTSLVIACVALGMGEGALFSLVGPVVFQLVGPDNASQGMGCLLGLLCVPATVGPPVAGDGVSYLHATFIILYLWPPLT
ncbi:hypothetical protein BaRGS_00006121 [Batillaria attramentaria]|uniref:Uncharacterized protein n=1 Tax=Batillaria attramentaria TaxID=370345 RepID=A0ABD0LU01_9CAEN